VYSDVHTVFPLNLVQIGKRPFDTVWPVKANTLQMFKVKRLKFKVIKKENKSRWQRN